MKKFMLSLLVMFTLIGCIGTNSYAAYDEVGQKEEIAITPTGNNSVLVDWSGLESTLKFFGYSGITYDLYIENVLVLEKTSLTSFQVSNLLEGVYYSVDIYAYYTKPDGEIDWDVFFDMILPLEQGGTTVSPSVPSEPTTPTPSVPSEPTPSTPSEPTPSTPSEPTPSTPATTITVSKPSVDKVEIADGKVYVKAKNIDANADRIEWEIYDKKTGKLVKSATSYNVDATIYGVNGRKVYYARCRVIAKDSYYNDVPSEWSGKKYFVAQPKITSTRKDVKVSSINIKWKKVTGAKNYTVYAKKENSKKWVKVKTTSKTSYKLTKIKGKKVNLRSSDYNFRVITNAKVNGKTIKSSNKEYCEAYVY